MNRFGLGFASRIDGAELRQQRREAVEIDWGAMSRGVNRGRMAQLELCVDDSFLEDFRRRDWDCIADGKVGEDDSKENGDEQNLHSVLFMEVAT